MPKMKTKKGAAKRLNALKSGKVKFGRARKRHLLEHKSAKMKRQARGGSYVHEAHAKAIKQLLPYG